MGLNLPGISLPSIPGTGSIENTENSGIDIADLNITMGNGGKMTIHGTDGDDSVGIYNNLAGEQWIDTDGDGQYGSEDIMIADYLDQYNADNDTNITESQVRMEVDLAAGDDSLTIGKGVSVNTVTDNIGANTINVDGHVDDLTVGQGIAHSHSSGGGWFTSRITLTTYSDYDDNEINVNGSVGNITGGRANDTYDVSSGASVGKITDSYGDNNIDINGVVGDIITGDGVDNITFGMGAASGTVSAGSGNDNIAIDAGAVIDELRGDGGVDTITGTGTVKTIINDVYDLIDSILEDSQDEE